MMLARVNKRNKQTLRGHDGDEREMDGNKAGLYAGCPVICSLNKQQHRL
jgi:hypothetical protein